MSSGLKVTAMAAQPTKMVRPKHWDDAVEEAYRFQKAGWRDAIEYQTLTGNNASIDRWPHNGYIKKLCRKADGFFYYYNKERECPDNDIHRTKLYEY
ncbi:meiosis expressed gene 1 protein homolog [Pecten maximus]|uniref:meiosis expressed gene 1 protein homolog n=1 Tax=Pecten maximus TaxID=6579 RepID=UPI00145912E3|nr:meiosis expressed gene 1 protein homolog [Pecten maximus]